MDNKKLIVALLIVAIVFSAISIVMNISLANNINSTDTSEIVNRNDNGSGTVGFTLTNPTGGSE